MGYATKEGKIRTTQNFGVFATRALTGENLFNAMRNGLTVTINGHNGRIGSIQMEDGSRNSFNVQVGNQMVYVRTEE